MDSFEWNKIAGWVLTAAIAVLGLSIATDMIYEPHAPEQKGYVVEGVEAEAETGAPAAEAEKPIAFYLASANPEKGANVFKKCAACHTINQGGANAIGPNLFGTVGKPAASHAGFAYSDALKSKGGSWGFEEMSQWLKSPKAYVPGNKMSFAGLGKPQDRADVIAYLNTQGSNLPLPAVPAEVAAADATEAVQPGKAPDVTEATPATATARGGPAAVDVSGRAKDDTKDQ